MKCPFTYYVGTCTYVDVSAARHATRHLNPEREPFAKRDQHMPWRAAERPRRIQEVIRRPFHELAAVGAHNDRSRSASSGDCQCLFVARSARHNSQVQQQQPAACRLANFGTWRMFVGRQCPPLPFLNSGCIVPRGQVLGRHVAVQSAARRCGAATCIPIEIHCGVIAEPGQHPTVSFDRSRQAGAGNV